GKLPRLSALADFMRSEARGFLSGGINLAANYGKTRTSQRNPRFWSPGHVPTPVYYGRHPGRIPALWLRPPGNPRNGEPFGAHGKIWGRRRPTSVQGAQLRRFS